MVQSPLNYIGGKYKLLPQILPLFPKDINCFVDLFCGGCNVGINVQANKYIYNDICEPLIKLYLTIQNIPSYTFIDKVEEIINRYELSNVKKYSYSYYQCNSSKGLSSYNKDKYLNLRTDFNNMYNNDSDYYIMLYVLIIYSFNNQIRFNRNGEFNIAVGKRDFNQNMENKLKSFIKIIQEQNAIFLNSDFRNIELSNEDFVYVDPPYLITCATYNEQSGWTKDDEEDLLKYLDELNKRDIRFALSNVLESKGQENIILRQWLETNSQYKTIPLNYTYNNVNYHRQNKEIETKEVLIINY